MTTTSASPHKGVPPARPGPLRQRDFRLLLSGAAASQVGTQVTLVALPLVAVLDLKASAFEVGMLTAAETSAFLFFGLPAGAWVDRMRRLPLLVNTDIVRAVALASVPLASLAGVLTMAQLYVVALVVGVATVFFDVAHQSYLPSLLPREQLVSGNGALETVRSSGHVAGPGLGGVLVQVLGAPLAIVVDAVSYLVSALLLSRIRVAEAAPERGSGASLRAEIMVGLRFVLRHPVLRVIALATGASNFFSAILLAVETVYLVRVLDLSPAMVGLTLSAAAVGGIAGALTAGFLAGRLGHARVIWMSALVTGPFALLFPLASPGAAAWLFAVGAAVVFFGAVVYNVAQVSLRQALCPDELLGRMNATMRFLAWGSMPLGALVGGAVAETFGVRTAVWVCAVGFVVLPLLLLASPLRRIRDLPTGTTQAV